MYINPSMFRPGDLLRLVGYGVLYHTAHLEELPERDDLTPFLPAMRSGASGTGSRSTMPRSLCYLDEITRLFEDLTKIADVALCPL